MTARLVYEVESISKWRHGKLLLLIVDLFHGAVETFFKRKESLRKVIYQLKQDSLRGKTRKTKL